MNNDHTGKTLKAEVEKHIGNASLNFKHFEFRTFEQKEQKHLIKFPFQKYRSFGAGAATIFYKPISRTINF